MRRSNKKVIETKYGMREMGRFLVSLYNSTALRNVKGKIKRRMKFPFYLYESCRNLFRTDIDKIAKTDTLFFVLHLNEIESQVRPDFMAGLLHLVIATEGIPGDLIELGSFRGGSAILMGRLLNRLDSKRHIHACDTFEGHPYDDFTSKETGLNRKGSFSNVDMAAVRAKFEKFGVSSRISLIKGMFEDTLIPHLSNKRFSLAYIDCDIYDSTKFVMEFLGSRMADGGVIVIHDYDWDNWGVRKAVHEYLEGTDLKINLRPAPHIIIKRNG